MTAIVDARALVRDYRMGDEMVHALRGVSLAVHEREYVAIVGPSGCGKSTLLNLLGVIDRPTSGELSIAGERVDRLSDTRATEFRLRRIGFVFQRFYLMQALTARENVELPLAEAGMAGMERRDRALELLDYVGLRKRERHRPSQLSGGEQQRVAIARALANKPRLLLADEPTGNLDPATSQTVFEALHNLVKQTGVGALIATHNMELAGHMDRVFALKDGHLEERQAESREY